MKPMQTSRKEAILIMDSRFTPGMALRHQNLFGRWSQLYRAGDLYLDLTLKSEDAKFVLVGQVIAEARQFSRSHITLHGPNRYNTSPVNEYGIFHLNIQQKGRYELEFAMGQETFLIHGIEV
ncbi:hypothetical protein [Meiothermus sp.]|uniref:hypothetical protein n=1 Tax=Meiothermus sp. TaxID=1955249 RepID=UPI00307DEC1E